MEGALYRSTFDAPVGPLQISVSHEGKLVEILLPTRRGARPTQSPSPAATCAMNDVKIQLNEYFLGERRAFDLRLSPAGSQFDQRVWRKLLDIPYGATTSYGAIAGELGLLNGARAVGRANGANPIPIVIPCHRVIGSDGRLVGYGGGLPLKRALLELEGAISPPEPALF